MDIVAESEIEKLRKKREEQELAEKKLEEERFYI